MQKLPMLLAGLLALALVVIFVLLAILLTGGIPVRPVFPSPGTRPSPPTKPGRPMADWSTQQLVDHLAAKGLKFKAEEAEPRSGLESPAILLWSGDASVHVQQTNVRETARFLAGKRNNAFAWQWFVFEGDEKMLDAIWKALP